MIKQSLFENWSVRAVNELSEVPSDLREAIVPARVPGCVHTDLLRAGKIPDPYAGLNEYTLQWIGRTDWEYRTTFVADEKLFDQERIDLCFAGLDTVATIELNGSLIGNTQNMHRSFRFDVRKSLKRGANELRVTFASPVKYAFAMREKLGSRPWVNGAGGPFNFIRKMACNFGWDWGPVLVTSGIWKGVKLEGWSAIRFGAVRPTVVRDRDAALVRFAIDVQFTQGTEWNRIKELNVWYKRPGGLDLDCGAHFPALEDAYRTGKQSIGLEVKIEKADWWFPSGHGLQPLYDFEIGVYSVPKLLGGVERTEVWEQKIGLRTVELDTSPDAIGSKFVINVNNKPIFCKGFNWIPDDCFLDRACTPERYRTRIQQAIDSGANMLRVWGGGIYETDDFYNICDELGVLVWQDFPFACAMYPEEEPFASEVEAEARENVARLSSHPSLVLWNGNNENLWAYRDWGWKEHPDVVGKTWGKNFYLNLLPKIVKEVDPSRPYWAASPWSGDADVDNGIHPNDANHGNKHVWETWFKEDYSAYRKFAPRFCSEFGFQAPANFATIVRAVSQTLSPALSQSTGRGSEGISPSPSTLGEGRGEGLPSLDFGSLEMRHRQKSGNVHDDGDLRNLRHLARHFNLPGLPELIASLTVPEPRPPLPDPGVVLPLHHSQTPSTANFDDLHYLLQLNQCRALKLGVEWFRSRQPTCMGTLYWQLNDCWPGVTSWSCIDGDGRFKPLWYATRRFYAPRLLTIQPNGVDYQPGDPLTLFAINDTDEPWRYNVRVALQDFMGIPISEEIVRFDVPPRSVGSEALSADLITPLVEVNGEMIVAHGDAPATWFFLPDKHLRYTSQHCEGAIKHEGDVHRLTIRARNLLRDIVFAVDRIDPEATVDDNCITLLPGESRTLTIRSKQKIEMETLLSPPVYQCANRFGLGS